MADVVKISIIINIVSKYIVNILSKYIYKKLKRPWISAHDVLEYGHVFMPLLTYSSKLRD